MFRQRSQGLGSQEIPVPEGCRLEHVEGSDGWEGTGQAACWKTVLTLAGISVVWDRSPALLHPPHAALGTSLQESSVGLVEDVMAGGWTK